MISNKVSFRKKEFKYFIGYKDAKKLNLNLYFSKKWVHREDFDENKYISFVIKDDELLKHIMKLGKMLKIVSKKNW